MSTNNQLVIVIGAGVIGLTTAVVLQSAGYSVTILATQFPIPYQLHHDYVSPIFASPKAGAHWRSSALPSNLNLIHIDQHTLQFFHALATLYQDIGILSIPSFDVYLPDTPDAQVPWYKDIVHEFALLDKSTLPSNCNFGFRYLTYTFNPPKYLSWLMNLFQQLGGKFNYKQVSHIDEAYLHANHPNGIVINCSGLGARTLGGVEDVSVYPTRGQTVIVRAPHVKYTVTRLGPNGEFDYVIPRDDGLVILGGTYQANNWDLHPDKLISQQILRNCISICPQLQLYPGQSLEIVSHNVGLRPTRTDGIRIECEWRTITKGNPKPLKLNTKSIVNTPIQYLCIHNYGHGGSGYQSSWGSACHVLDLCRQSTETGTIMKYHDTTSSLPEQHANNSIQHNCCQRIRTVDDTLRFILMTSINIKSSL